MFAVSVFRQKTSRWVTCASAALLAAVLNSGIAHAQPEVTAEQVKSAIDRAVSFLKKQQNKANGQWRESDVYPGGRSGLATLALLNAGVPVEDEHIQRSLRHLRALKPTMTYSTSVITMVLCAAEPEKDLLLIKRNVDWLEARQNKDGPRKGAWGYGNIPGGDNSNTQFAMLALYEAERVGVPCNAQTWNLAHAYWQGCQNSDFSWGYVKPNSKLREPESAGTGSMTCAGIASMLISASKQANSDAAIEGDTVRCCGKQAPDDSVDKAIDWLRRHFTIQDNPESARGAGRGWHFYYLYALERVGRLSGRRLIGQHDWYREGAEMLVNHRGHDANGSWKGGRDNPIEEDEEIATSLALLFLAKGRRPVVVGKLEHGPGEDWNRHRHDVAHLTSYVEVKWKKDFPIGLSWQTIDIRKATVEDLLQAPVLFINGSLEPEINDEQVKRLRDYIDRGGFIFAEACCGQAAGPDSRDADPKSFDAGFRRLMERMFADRPEHRLQLLPPSHPVWHAEELVAPDQQRPLLGINFDCRTCVVYAPPPRPADDPAGNLSCYWELNTSRDKRPGPKVAAEISGAYSIGINVLAYATNRELKSKEDLFRLPTDDKPRDLSDRSIMYIAKLKHPGGCDAAPGALPSLLRAAERELKIRVAGPGEPLEITSRQLFNHHLVFMHGRSNFRLTPAEREQLKAYLSEDRGGTLLVDAVCANRAFAESFRREIEQIFPGQKLEPIPADHEMLTETFGGFKLSSVKRREPQVRGEGDRSEARIRTGPPELEGLKVGPDGRYAVIFSKYDLSCALEKHDSLECEGYVRDDAERIALNVLLYSLAQ